MPKIRRREGLHLNPSYCHWQYPPQLEQLNRLVSQRRHLPQFADPKRHLNSLATTPPIVERLLWQLFDCRFNLYQCCHRSKKARFKSWLNDHCYEI